MKAMRRVSRVAVVLALGMSCAVARADVFDDGMAAYRSGNYHDALGIWTILAGDGHVEAQFSLGFMYEFGFGVAPNPSQAFEWYLRAAEHGHEQAQRFVAAMFANGIGVERSVGQARKWSRIAAHETDDAIRYALQAEQARLFEALKSELLNARERYDAMMAAPRGTAPEPEASNPVS